MLDDSSEVMLKGVITDEEKGRMHEPYVAVSIKTSYLPILSSFENQLLQFKTQLVNRLESALAFCEEYLLKLYAHEVGGKKKWLQRLITSEFEHQQKSRQGDSMYKQEVLNMVSVEFFCLIDFFVRSPITQLH